jgi:ribosomal protein L7/L12
MKITVTISDVKSLIASNHNVSPDQVEVVTANEAYGIPTVSNAKALEELIAAFRKGDFPNKILLIKHTRQLTGLGLSEAKTLVERYVY